MIEYGLNYVYQEIERPLPPIFASMTRRGIRIDVRRLTRLGESLDSALATVLAGPLAGLNPGSPKQVAGVLYNDLELPILRRSKKTGGASTDEETLKMLQLRVGRIPFIESLLKYRELTKLKSTYVVGILERIGSDSRLHPDWLQWGTSTGRISSRNPNGQNIPASHIPGDYGSELRSCFIPADGFCFVVGDYSQIELRVMGVLAQEEVLLQAFREGRDVHAQVTQALGLAPELRWLGKNMNFGLGYGLQADGLALKLSEEAEGGRVVTKAEAQRYINLYWSRMPNLAKWVEDTKDFLRGFGYVETLFGRRQYIALTGNRGRDAALLREAVNMPVQGTAGDILKRMMKLLHKQLVHLGGHILLTVHDEFVNEVPEKEAGEFAEWVAAKAAGMENIGVPIEMVVGVGGSWMEAKK